MGLLLRLYAGTELDNVVGVHPPDPVTAPREDVRVDVQAGLDRLGNPRVL